MIKIQLIIFILFLIIAYIVYPEGATTPLYKKGATICAGDFRGEIIKVWYFGTKVMYTTLNHEGEYTYIREDYTHKCEHIK